MKWKIEVVEPYAMRLTSAKLLHKKPAIAGEVKGTPSSKGKLTKVIQAMVKDIFVTRRRLISLSSWTPNAY